MATDKQVTLEQILDNRTGLQKIGQGDFASLSRRDVAEGAQTFNGAASWIKRANKVQGKPASSLPLVGGIPGVGQVLMAGDVAISTYAGYADAMEKEKLYVYFNDKAIDRLKYDPVYREKIKELDTEPYFRAGGAVASIAGALGGGALLIAFGPIASVLGAMGGGYVTGSIYDRIFKRDAQEQIDITMQAAKMQAAGEQVPAEVIFAGLAANLKGTQGEHASRLLKNLTGTESFLEALGEPKNLEKLRAMMHDPTINSYIAAQTGMIPDPVNINRPVAEQYAELINTGKLYASKILEPGAGMYAAIEAANNRHANATDTQIPSVPFARRQQQIVPG
jgi:hypothetical protein